LAFYQQQLFHGETAVLPKSTLLPKREGSLDKGSLFQDPPRLELVALNVQKEHSHGYCRQQPTNNGDENPRKISGSVRTGHSLAPLQCLDKLDN
jgi:hypothetical protein